MLLQYMKNQNTNIIHIIVQDQDGQNNNKYNVKKYFKMKGRERHLPDS
jgi:hypothetical protein